MGIGLSPLEFHQCVGVVISFMSPQRNPEQENLNKSLTRPLSVGVAELKQVALQCVKLLDRKLALV